VRVLADENVLGAPVLALRQAGHDVEWICESAAGAADAHVRERAVRAIRVVVTFDKDFGYSPAIRTHQAKKLGSS
jgi:hypothetical protein